LNAQPAPQGRATKAIKKNPKTTKYLAESACQIALFLLTLFSYIGNKTL
jgi:hypothetical protein